MTIKVSSKKAKGRKGQQLVCKKISEMLNIPWGKDELIRSREGGQSGTDVVLIGEALHLFPYSLEVKIQERWDVPGAIRQAKKNQKKGTDWMVIMKKNNVDPIVIMDMEAFFKHYKEYLEWTVGE